MAARASLRPLSLVARAAIRNPSGSMPRSLPVPLVRHMPALQQRRNFQTSRPAFINKGDHLPDLEVLMEDTPGNRVNLAEEVKSVSDALIIGVPAAFSGACSATHIPSYIHHPATKEFGLVAVVSVNDVFVMKAWGESLDPARQSGIRFLADPTGAFTKALDLAFDGSAIFGGDRSKRYAIVVKNGVVESVAVEPDNTGTSVSLADKVLGPPKTTGVSP